MRAMNKQGGQKMKRRWMLRLPGVVLAASLAFGVAAGGALVDPPAASAQDDKTETDVKVFKRQKEARKPQESQKGPNFKAKAAAMGDAARKVAADAKSGNLGSDPKAVVGSIGATCGACHKVYRGPKV